MRSVFRPPGGIRSVAVSAFPTARASVTSGNNARRRVVGHSRNSPGSGSSTGSSCASTYVTDVAPSSKQLSSADSGSRAPSSNDSCQKPLTALTQPQPPLQVVNVRAALLKGRMVEDFLVEGHVGLDSFDDHLCERVLHARDRGLAAFSVRNDLAHERVVVGRNVVSRVDVTIDADARTA